MTAESHNKPVFETLIYTDLG